MSLSRGPRLSLGLGVTRPPSPPNALHQPDRADAAGVCEWSSLAMLDTIGFAEELGMMWDDEAERRRGAVREAFGGPRSALARRYFATISQVGSSCELRPREPPGLPCPQEVIR